MIFFPLLRAGRIAVQLRELTIAESIDLAAIPPERDELATTRLLQLVVKHAEGEYTDPRAWTIQERLMVKVHYLAHTDMESPNFAIGVDGARLTDYLRLDLDGTPASVHMGDALGSSWTVRQLIGAEAEAMESLCSARFDWITADMAARLRTDSDSGEDAPPDVLADAPAYKAWLKARIDVFKAMPESEYCTLLGICQAGCDQLAHLMLLGLDEGGFIVLPAQEGSGADMAPARFPVPALLSDVACILGAQSGESGRDHGSVRQHPVPAGAATAA